MITKKTASILVLLAFSISMACADTKVTRHHDFEASQTGSVRIDARVGTIHVEPSDSGNIEIELVISEEDQRGWFRRSPDITAMDLNSQQRGDQLRLSFTEKNVKTDWVVRLPSGLEQLDIELGVGEVDVRAAEFGMYVDVGVGSVNLQAMEARTGRVDLSVGVGDTIIRGGSSTESRRALVSSETSARGNGDHAVKARAGVGKVEIELM